MAKTKQKNSNQRGYSSRLTNFVSAYNKSQHKWIIILSLIMLCFILAIIILYQPAKNYYINIRENDKLQAQLEAIKETNESLAKDIEALQTDEGIKQKAIDNLGLIQKGEHIGVVSGTENENTASNNASSTSSKLAYKNIKTKAKWYTAFCDAIFNIHE